MIFVQFNVGDWIAGTRYLSAVEKGIYIDLIALYYEKEAPILRSYYDRIRNAYTDDEKKAFDFVIKEFFTEQPDGFHHERCDKEIELMREKSAKARKSVEARWSKSKTQYERNTNVIRSNNERNTDAILTNNYELLNKDNDIYVETSESFDSAMCASIDEFGVTENEKGSECIADTQSHNTIKRCPYTKVIEVYHRLLPTLPTVNTDLFSRNKADQAVVKARWQDFAVLEKCKSEDEVLYCFERYFQIVQKSKFLLGQTTTGTWKADFRWLMKKANFEKVLELKYS